MNPKPILSSDTDLDVYQRSMRLGVEIDAMRKKLPKHECWEEGQPLRESALAIRLRLPKVMAENVTPLLYRRFARNALSSCDETQGHLKRLHDCGSISKETDDDFGSEYHLLGKKLNHWLETIENF